MALVGIVGYRVDVGDERTSDPKIAHTAMMITYVKAVRAAGAVPVVVPVLDPVDANGLVGSFDGLIITGGTDLDPAHYGAARDPRTLEPDHERDAVEMAVARACVAANHPLLAICRGAQVLNVALGGSLHQHLDGHMERDRYNLDVHEVRLQHGSRLAGIVGAEQIGTNSLHHQCIDRLGEGVRATAFATDGTVEAIEVDAAPNVVGVQWHPELLRHRAEHLALFSALLPAT